MGAPLQSCVPTGSVCTFASGCHQRAGSASVKVVGIIWSVGLWFLAISGAVKVLLTTVYQWGTVGPNVVGHGSPYWFPGSALWHTSSKLFKLVSLVINICT